MPFLGILFTGWSWFRSSRIAQYALAAGALLLIVYLWGRSKRNEGHAEAVALAIAGVAERMEHRREIHREIRTLPLADRADRLRQLDRSAR